jgi:polysaccharide export outer membrane protein
MGLFTGDLTKMTQKMKRDLLPDLHLPLQKIFVLGIAGLILAGIPINAQSSQSTCTDSLFSSSPACQQLQQEQNSDAANNRYNNSISNDPSMQGMDNGGTQRQPNNAQVYVDSAGNDWQHTTAATDRNRFNFQPDPVTDFQKLARSSTGEFIPIFGRDLFHYAPSTFAPADEIPSLSNYVVGPGDEVLVRLWGAEATSSNNQLTVDTSGNIYIPHVGAIHVAGLRSSELQDKISAEVNHTFRNYRISVSLGHLRSIQIYVVGEARRPGAYTISGLSTVLNALFASGGPNVQGSMRHIQVRRNGQTLPEFDLYDLVLTGDKSRDIRLESGDTIFIPPVGPQVAFAGSVRHPAIYELKDASTLGDVLRLAGGFSATGAPGQIKLERIDSDLQRRAVTINLDAAGRAMTLRDGDVLYAGHISRAYELSVTIRGNLANPGRFAWTPGMRLSNIIPDRRSLLTNNYWRERNRLGAPVPLFEPSEFNNYEQQQSPYANQRAQANGQQRFNGALPNSLTQSNRGVLNGQISTQDALSAVQPPSADDDEQDAGLAIGGVVSTNAYTMNPQTSGNVSPNGYGQTGNLDRSQGQRGLQPQSASQQDTERTERLQKNQVRIAAPEIDWSYAVIERLNPKTLKSVLVSFNLGKLVQDHDERQNLELQPGDVVTILSQHDILVPQHEQTKYVRLEGEFVSAGIYSVGPDETLDEVVRRAGGFTPQAYLYGSSFQRESARIFQQQRLDEYISELSSDMERATAVRGASSPSGISDPNALLEERSLIDQLRQLRATGRVVLEFRPETVGIETVPHIPLENGDVFRVPSRPNTVSVIGAVYGQNVFLYDSHRHLEDYLALAGKPNRIADKNHAYIIRADGSIYSRERAKGVFSNDFDASRVYPGDSIVVPEKLIKPTVLKQLTDYTQILSSFGLAAAAINVIR